MSWAAVAIVGGSVVSGVIGANASRNAANTQASAANRATDTQLQMFNTVNDQQKPYREAGYTALGDIGAKSDYFNHTFGAADLNANLAPGYEFAKTQGEGAVTNMANSMDGLGGNSLAEISKWTTGFAQQGYQQAYENYTKNQTNIFNRLASIAGLGQTAGSASATGAPAFASGISSTIQGAGNAQAAGTVGGANAITGGINNAMGWYQLNNLMNRGGTSGATTGGGP